MTALPSWVEQAAKMPVAFAQVREDACIDLWLIEQLCFRQLEVMMVGSGGCTAAALAASNRVAHLHIVDANPAQIALVRLKLHLLQHATPQERGELLGHLPLYPIERCKRIIQAAQALNLPPDVFDILSFSSRIGFDHAGRYELLFAQLRKELRTSRDDLASLLSLSDPAEQSRRTAPETPLGQTLDEAFDDVMALPNLIHLFGQAATRNSHEPFSRHFARRTRHVLSTLPAADNPYLWQMFWGSFPNDVVYPWLAAPAPVHMPIITYSIETMDAALAKTKDDFDIIHLSNILDWLTPEEAAQTLEHAWRALRPGGYTIIRQLNSTLDIPSLHPEFNWQIDQAKFLHARDRSFFYRALHLGKKP